MFWGVIFLLIGIGWLLQEFGIVPADIEFFWAIIFIALGLSILFGRKSSKWCCWDWGKDKE